MYKRCKKEESELKDSDKEAQRESEERNKGGRGIVVEKGTPCLIDHDLPQVLSWEANDGAILGDCGEAAALGSVVENVEALVWQGIEAVDGGNVKVTSLSHGTSRDDLIESICTSHIKVHVHVRIEINSAVYGEKADFAATSNVHTSVSWERAVYSSSGIEITKLGNAKTISYD